LTEFQVWPGVTRLPNYRPHKLSFYRPQRLSDAWPILYDIPFAENLANQLLQQRAQKRIGAEQALRHRYFSDLPQKIHELGDGE
jgi:cyclin-dependent kinase 14